MTKELERIIAGFAGQRVAVLGDLMLDEWLWGKVSRISPEAPIPVVDIQRVTCTPGGACNVAANLAALGAGVELFGVIGDDYAGHELVRALDRLRVCTRGALVDRHRLTTLKTRIIAHSQQVVRADRESREPIGEAILRRLAEYLSERVTVVDAFVISDYAKGVAVPELLAIVIDAARNSGKPVVVDPKGIDYSKYRRATVITPNRIEAAQACYIEINDESSLYRAGVTLLNRLECDAVLITRGEEGMSLFEPSGAVTHLPPRAREVYDVTGAGDTVVATLTLALAAGATFVEGAVLANHAAGVVVGKVGTATVSQDELSRSLDDIQVGVWPSVPSALGRNGQLGLVPTPRAESPDG